MLKYKQVEIPEQKAKICNSILHTLPEWFGVESSINDYVNTVKNMPFWVAFDGDNPIGFIALKVHNIYTSEIYVMGILPQYHRQGIGTHLIENCESFCRSQQKDFLTVKTLDGSVQSDSYAKTRKFYLAMKFCPLEVFPLYWDKDNPCLFMIKFIG